MKIFNKRNLWVAGLAAASVLLAEERPNIVFVEVDDLSYKYLGCMGNKTVQTPHIDSLAQNGIIFKNAVCQGMMCGPSRNSLITGKYPHNLGFYRNGQMGSLPKNIWTIPAALQRAGYYSAWIGKSHIHPYHDPNEKKTYESGKKAMEEQMGFDFAYHSLGRAMLGGGAKESGDGYVNYLKSKGLYQKFRDEFPGISTLETNDYMDGFFTTTAINVLKNYQEDRPFFMWINYSCPHGPYDVQKEFHNLYKDAQMDAMVDDDLKDIPEDFIFDSKPYRSREKQNATRSAYAASITYLDKQVGRLVAELKNAGKYENTVIFFFSDHGVMMGDHGLTHKGNLFRQVVNPSLIISYPKKFRQNIIEEQPVELLDILKTSLDLSQASDNDKNMPYGYSLIPLLTGEGEYEGDGAFAEIEDFHMIRTKRYKYIYHQETPILFDLENDPEELVNIVQTSPEVAEKLKQKVLAWLNRTGPILPPNGKSREYMKRNPKKKKSKGKVRDGR